jgi:hypothetical protein
LARQTNDFFRYKGFPLVRKDDLIYFGNMSDPCVVMLQIQEKVNQGGIDVATKIKLYEMKTDEGLRPDQAIVRSIERNSLYEALDIAYVWLSKAS